MGTATPEELEELLEQMAEIQDALEAGGFYLLDMKIEEAARGLGIDAIGLDRDVSALSGGQRTKVLLAKLLLEQPEVLLLDEPTNYLDVEHIHWLTNYLKEYPHAFLLISHDTEFMNKCVDVIFHLEFTKMTRYTATYEKFLELAEINKNQHINAYEKQREFIKSKKTSLQRTKLVIQRQAVQRVVKNNSIVWNLSIAPKQQLNLNSHLKKVVQVVASSLKVKM